MTKDFFLEKKVKDILIPGIGYGSNAKVFIDSGINVTGIEISKTAIDLARQNGLNISIFHGSVNKPFLMTRFMTVFFVMDLFTC